MQRPQKTDYTSFYFLNATQFLGALNDNIFKLLVIYLLIHVKGPAFANSILSLAGAIFVIPFLLFLSSAGILADRISKRSIIVFAKVIELITMIFAIFAVYQEWEFGVYAALFLMATHSALFNPSKYGIILELVDPSKVSKANGSLTSFTYLAIILGTFLASFITDVTDKNFVIEAAFCIFIAICGLITSLGIKRTEPQSSTKKINPIFVYEIYQTLKFCWKIPHLLPAIFGSSFFLFIGAFTQLNIIPFAIQSLGLSEVGGGYLFLATAVGIAIGALLSGKLSKDKVEPGISCICGFFIVIFFFSLYLFSHSLLMTIISLGMLGLFGGAYLIPFDAFLQINSPDEKRGQIIAAASFFSFIGVLCAAIALYVISEKLGFSAASGFGWMALITLIANIIITGRLSSLFFPFVVQKLLLPFKKIKLHSPVPDPTSIIILESNSWHDALLLFSCVPKLKILIPENYMQHFPWFNGLIECIRIIPPEPDMKATLKNLFGEAKRFQGQNSQVCLFFHKRKDSEPIIEAYKKVFRSLNINIVFAHGTKERIKRRFLLWHTTEKRIHLRFTND